MYQVVCVKNGTEHMLLDMRDEEYQIGTPKLTLQINGAGSLEFYIYPPHPEYRSIERLTTLIKVYKINKTGRKWLFTGRVTKDEKDIYNRRKIKCEGILTYLMDSIVHPYEFKGTPADYVTQLIQCHNSQVNTSKQFIINTLDLADADSNNNIVRANKNYPDTCHELNDKVIKLLNAYICAYEGTDGKIYFDCTQTINHYNTQPIRLGENILDLKQTWNAASIQTVIIGIGAEDDEGNRPTVTVSNAKAIEKYGRIVGTIEFENVSTIEQLTRKTTAYLDSVLAELNTIEVRAVDLNMTDPEIQEIQLGYAYIESVYNNLNHVRMLVSKMDIYLLQPDRNKFVLGTERKSLSSTVTKSAVELDSKVKAIANSTSEKINAAVDNATQLITGAKGGYVILDCGENADKHPEQILIMDAPEKKNATNVIRINKNGIGFSTTGYDGTYRNAWTIDGNLVADFITTGSMFADRIRGGTLLIGGSDTAKDGKIEVLDSKNNIIAVIDINGIDIRKGSIKGTEIIAGGSENTDGRITIKDASGTVRITIDVNGINVNDKYKVGMDGNMEAISISGEAINQINDIIDNSEAMKTAKEAIKKAKEAAEIAKTAAEKAQSAADKAQETADTANEAAKTANAAASTANSAATEAKNAAEAAKSAAEKAQTAIDALKVTVKNLNDTMVNDINKWLLQLSAQIQELGKPGIS